LQNYIDLECRRRIQDYENAQEEEVEEEINIDLSKVKVKRIGPINSSW